MALTLDRYCRMTDLEIIKEHDRLKNFVPSSKLRKLLLEWGNLQSSVAENVAHFEKCKEHAQVWLDRCDLYFTADYNEIIIYYNILICFLS